MIFIMDESTDSPVNSLLDLSNIRAEDVRFKVRKRRRKTGSVHI